MSSSLGGTFPIGSFTIHRMGYGAMRLAGPGVFGPPKDPAEAAAVLHAAIDAGIDHIDTSDFYGPETVNQLIRDTLSPYPESLVVITKVGTRRTKDNKRYVALSKDELTAEVHENLRNLGLGQLPVVNLRVGAPFLPPDLDVTEPFSVLAELQQQGLIKHLGLSNITSEQLTAGQKIAPVVCVQNSYNIASRGDDLLVDTCANQNIAFVPYFPLGGFQPVQAATLDAAANFLGAKPMQVALAWLLRRAPNMCIIPGTSSRAHLAENIAAADLTLPDQVLGELQELGKSLPPA